MEGFYINRMEKITRCALVTFSGVENSPGVAYRLFSALAENDVKLIFILQSENAASGSVNIGFTVPADDAPKVRELFSKTQIGGTLSVREHIAVLSVGGVGLYHNPDVTARIFEVLCDRSIDVHLISLSEVKIFVAVDEERIDEAYRAVRGGFADME